MKFWTKKTKIVFSWKTYLNSITKDKPTPVFTVAWSNLPLPVPGCQLWHRYRIPYQHQGHAICFTRTVAYVNLSIIGTLPHTHTYTCACKPYLSLLYALLLLSTSFQPETNYCWSVQLLRHWCRNCSTLEKDESWEMLSSMQMRC